MKKTEIILKVSDYTNSTIDWQKDAFQEGTIIAVEAYDKNDQYMVDEHIASDIFPELGEINLEDETEGYMSYIGDLNSTQLVSKLISMGFNARLIN
jgi:hypothetical protein